MLGNGKDKKLIKSIVELRPVEQETGSKELLDVHSRLMKGRTSFETVILRAALSKCVAV